jgi:fatty acid desaturase
MGHPDDPIPTPSRQRVRELDLLLVKAVADLHGPITWVERLASAGRLLGLLLLLVAAIAAYWLLPAGFAGCLVLLLAGVAYALLLIATHEMVHGTLLGWRSLEFGLGCLLSWPMAWPFATYARLHLLHHRWNGGDGRDPERTQRLPADPLPASPLQGWLQCHPFALRCLLLGGVGLIVATARQGWRLRTVDLRLDQARRLDGAGVILLHSCLLALAIHQGVLLRYALLWLVLERVIGAVVQYRGLVEHHGLWRQAAGQSGAEPLPQRLRQLATSRDVASGPWLNALMGGLPHHSTHHAFPALSTARLPEATLRLHAVLRSQGWPLPPRLKTYAAALRETALRQEEVA